MFNLCTNLTSLNISNFDISNVKSIDRMFANCYNLTTLDISSFNTANVTSMPYVFFKCSSLKTIFVSNLWDVSKVTYSDNMFYECTQLVGAVPYNSSKITATMANYQNGYFTGKFYYKDSG
jgi:surface protein